MAELKPEELEKQIKARQFSRVYVLYGTEQMYVKNYTEKLTNAINGSAPSDFNFHTFGGDVNLDELAAAVQVVPFMSEYNCVLVSDIFLDRLNADDLNKFKAICKSVAEGSVLILSMPSYIPKKNKTAFTAIINRAKKDGTVVAFNKIDERTLEKHIAKWANENGKFITQSVARNLMRVCGTDLNRLKNEVDKLCAYTKGESIEPSSVDLLVSQTLETKIFALSDYVLAGNGDAAFQVLDTLFYQKEEPVMMLYVLSTAMIDAYRIRVADESGVSREQLAEDFAYGKRAFALDKARRSTRRVSTEALRKCLDAVLKADIEMKTVPVNNRIHIEKLIATLLLLAR